MQSHNNQERHTHQNEHKSKGKKLFLTIIINVAITITQVIGGLISGSLALLSDATHNFSDVIALIVSWVATKIAEKPYSEKQTFGYKRIETIAAIINVAAIIVIAINIFFQAIKRLSNPVSITSSIVMWLALLSIVLNGLSVLIIREDSKESLNIKSAYIHLFSDMLTSIAVLLGGIIMYFTKIYWIDIVISLVIALYLIYISVKMLIEAMKIIMEFAPDNISMSEIKKEIETFDFVNYIYHVHFWKIAKNDIKIEFHLNLNENYNLKDTKKKLDIIKAMLKKKFSIEACTIEPEYSINKSHNLIKDER